MISLPLFGTPADVRLAELAIEFFILADAAKVEAVRACRRHARRNLL